MNRWLRFLPLLVLVAFVGAAIWRLDRPAEEHIPSKMIGESLAKVRADPALPNRPGVWIGDPAGGPRVINFFASWCVPCIAEAPLLLQLKNQGVAIEGIAVRDRPQDIAAFLAANGDPFRGVGADPDSGIQIQFGSSGVPETFLVDSEGTVRYQHIGPLEPKDVAAIGEKWKALGR